MSEHVSSSQQSSSATSRTCFCAAAEQSPALSTLYSEICRSIAGPSSMPAGVAVGAAVEAVVGIFVLHEVLARVIHL